MGSAKNSGFCHLPAASGHKKTVTLVTVGYLRKGRAMSLPDPKMQGSADLASSNSTDHGRFQSPYGIPPTVVFVPEATSIFTQVEVLE
jgi:hypothetical protein